MSQVKVNSSLKMNTMQTFLTKLQNKNHRTKAKLSRNHRLLGQIHQRKKSMMLLSQTFNLIFHQVQTRIWQLMFKVQLFITLKNLPQFCHRKHECSPLKESLADQGKTKQILYRQVQVEKMRVLGIKG